MIEANRVVLSTTHNSHRLERAQHAKARDICSELGLVKRHGHERNSTEVVKLVGLDIFKSRHQAGEIGEVTGNNFNKWELVAQHFGTRVVLPLHHAVHLVALAVQELC